MEGEEQHIQETLKEPDVVVRSGSDPDVLLYHKRYSHPNRG
jgi:hypothetical protein